MGVVVGRTEGTHEFPRGGYWRKFRERWNGGPRKTARQFLGIAGGYEPRDLKCAGRRGAGRRGGGGDGTALTQMPSLLRRNPLEACVREGGREGWRGKNRGRRDDHAWGMIESIPGEVRCGGHRGGVI